MFVASQICVWWIFVNVTLKPLIQSPPVTRNSRLRFLAQRSVQISLEEPRVHVNSVHAETTTTPTTATDTATTTKILKIQTQLQQFYLLLKKLQPINTRTSTTIVTSTEQRAWRLD